MHMLSKWMVWMNDLSIYLAVIVDSGGQRKKNVVDKPRWSQAHAAV